MPPKKQAQKSKITSTEDTRLVDGLEGNLSLDEVRTTGAIKLILRELSKSSDKANKLEKEIKSLSGEKATMEKENAVLEAKLKYSKYWDVLIVLAGFSAGGVLAFWENPGTAVLLGVMTLALLVIALRARKV